MPVIAAFLLAAPMFSIVLVTLFLSIETTRGAEERISLESAATLRSSDAEMPPFVAAFSTEDAARYAEVAANAVHAANADSVDINAFPK